MILNIEGNKITLASQPGSGAKQLFSVFCRQLTEIRISAAISSV